MPLLVVLSLVLLAACAPTPSVPEEDIRQYLGRMNADCQRKGEADRRVPVRAAQGYCACVGEALRLHMTYSEWQAALRLERSGEKEAEWQALRPHRAHMHSCAQTWLKPALAP